MCCGNVLISSVLRHDARTTSYKIALVRTINDVGRVEYSVYVAGTMQHPDALLLASVEHDLSAHRQSPQARCQVVAAPPHAGLLGKRMALLVNRGEQPGGGLQAALLGEVDPDFQKVGRGLRCAQNLGHGARVPCPTSCPGACGLRPE